MTNEPECFSIQPWPTFEQRLEKEAREAVAAWRTLIDSAGSNLFDFLEENHIDERISVAMEKLAVTLNMNVR